MKYVSTRGQAPWVFSAEAIKNGLAPDAGLYMPEKLVVLSEKDKKALLKMNYIERAAYVMSMYLSDFTKEELNSCCAQAYGSGFDPEPARVVPLDRRTSILELFNGPTCAFKDMALQVMPRLLTRSLEKTGEKRRILILTATSGDTGKAALEGYRDVPGVYISVYYPTYGVSEMQKRQMEIQQGDNVNVSAIYGNFDDAQTAVKEIFADKTFAEKLNRDGWVLSSANSINWGRLLPQIVYYISAWCDLVNKGITTANDTFSVTVPTGNFGNILAAFMAKKMGIPINKLVCASNSNNVLTDFFNTGIYDKNRAFYKTSSPSMDILVSSNLERLLYLCRDSGFCADCMRQLSDRGAYSVGSGVLSELRQDFAAYFCAEKDCREKISETFSKHDYLVDPHTAVALFCADRYAEENPGEKMLVVSTASAYKFPGAVYDSIVGESTQTSEDFGAASYEKAELLSKLSGVPVPLPLRDLFRREIRFSNIIDPEDIRLDILKFTGSRK